MLFINSTSDQWGSRLIRYGRESKSSHFAIGYGPEDDPCTLIVHSMLGKGVHPVWLKEFKKDNRVTSILKVGRVTEDEIYNAYRNTVKEIGGKDYDDGAIAWWTGRSLLEKIFGLTFKNPDNTLGKDEDFYCVEVLWGVRHFLREIGFKIPEERGFFERMDPEDAREWLLTNPRIYEIPTP